MKLKTVRRHVCGGILAVWFATHTAHAYNIFWDTAAGDFHITGGSGTWNATSTNWSDSGGISNIAWNPNNTAVFGDTSGTVTLAAGMIVSGLTFNDSSGYVISGNTLTFSTAGAITANVDASISSVIGGSSAISKLGMGTLTLTGVNTFTGQLAVEGGVLSVAAVNNTGTNGVLGNSVSAVILGRSGGITGTLEYTGANAASNKMFTLATSGIGAFQVDTDTSNLTLSGVIDGSGALSKTGAGTLTLSAANSYTGGTTASGGTLALSGAGTLGWFAGSLTVENAAILNLGSTSQTVGVVRLKNDAQINTGTLTGSSFSLEAGTISSSLAGASAGLMKSSDGIVILTGANIYGGSTLVTAGTLQMAKLASLSASTQVTVYGNASLVLNVGGSGEFTATSIATLLNTASFYPTSTLGLNVTGTIPYTANLTGYLGLSKLGTGTLTLSGAGNSYSGGTTVSAGILQISGSGTLGDNYGALTVDGATVNLAATSQTVGVVSLKNDAQILTGTLQASSFALEAGTISSILAGTGGLAKNGGGTVTLSGANTYAGGTRVLGGVLNLSGAGSLGMNTEALTVDGAVLNLGSVTQTLGAVSVLNDGQITGTLIGTSFSLESGTISAKLQGAGAILTKKTPGTVTLSGVNTYTGATLVNAGTLQFTKLASLPASSPVSVGNNATLAVNVGGSGEFLAANIATLLGTATFDTNSKLALDTSNAAGGSFSYASNISGVLGLSKLGAGTLVLSGANTYIGGTTVTGGTLLIAGSGTLGMAPGALMADGDTTCVDLGSTTQTVGAVILTNGASLLTGTLTGTSFASEGGTISTNIGGAFAALTKSSSGTLTLTGANTYDGGVTLNDGVLVLGSSGALGTNGTILLRGGTLQFGVSNTTDYSGRFSTAPGQSFNIDTYGQDVTFASSLTSAGGSLTKSGTGTLTLSGGNFYGATSILAGTLQVTKVASLPGQWTFGQITLSEGSTLAVNVGGSGEFTANDIGNLLTNANFYYNTTLAIDTTHAGGVFTYAQNISSPIAISKLGTGTLELTGANTYDGGTLVRAGTLSFNTLSDTLGATSALGNIGTIFVSNSTLEYTGATAVSTSRFRNGASGAVTGSTTIQIDQVGGSLNLAGGYADSQDLVKTGPGKLTLSGSSVVGFNSASVDGGTLLMAMTTSDFTNCNAVGSITDVKPGATLQLTRGADGQILAVANDPSRQLHMTGGTLDLNGDTSNRVPMVDGSGTITNTSALAATLNVLLNANKTFSGNIVDGLGTVKVNISNTAHSGTAPSGMIWTLSGTNTYSGGTNVTLNTVLATTPQSLGSNYSSFGKVVVAGGATLAVQTGDGSSGWNSTQISDLRAAATFSTNAGFGLDTSNGDFTYTSTMAGALKLVKLGGNTLTLAVANTHSGGTVIGNPNQGDAGTLLLADTGTLGTGAILVYAGTLDLGGTTQTLTSLTLGEGAAASTASVAIGNSELKLGGNVTYSGINNPNGAIITSGGTGKLSLQASRTFTVGDSTAAAYDLTISANIQNGTGTGALVKAGPGTLLLSGTNTYTGTTTVSGGTLQASKPGALPLPASGTSSISGTTTLAINVGGPGEYGASDITALLAKTSFSAPSMLGLDTTNAAGGSFTAPVLSGGLGLNKLGIGTLVLAGANTYTGTTLVSAGTLQVNGSLGSGGLMSVPVTGTLAVSNGASIARDVTVSGGVFNHAGTLAASSTLTLSSGTVNTVGTAASAGTVMLPAPGAPPVLNAPVGQELAVTTKILQTMSDGTLTYSASSSATPFKVGGSNVVNHVDKLILTGGTTKIERIVGAMGPGLDVRAWQNLNSVLEGSSFDLPGAPPSAPTHSTFAGTLGYATGAIHFGSSGGEHFTADGTSGVQTGPLQTGYSEHYTVEYRGKLFIATAGNYSFSTTSDDGSALWIDPSSSNPSYSEAKVQNGGDHGMAQANSSPVSLTAGYHDIIVRFYENGGGSGIWVQWDPNGGSSFVDIPGANYFHGSQAADTLNMPTTEVAVNATSALNLAYSGKSTLGNLSLAAGTLTFATATHVSVDSLSASGDSAIGAGIPISLRSGNVTVASGKTLTLNSVVANSTTAPVTLALTKLGDGTLSLGGVNTYTGATTVSAGKLTVASAGRINTSSGVSIGAGEFNYNSATALTQGISFSGAGGILSGTGTITPAVNIPSGNTLAPGNSIGSVTFSGGLTLSGIYAAQLGTPSALATPATGKSDRAVVTGDLNLSGGTLALSDNAGAGTDGSAGVGAYRLMTFTGTRSGAFSSVTITQGSPLHPGVVYNDSAKSVDLNVYRLAAALAPSTPVNLGNVRVGGTLTGSATVTNTATNDGFSELLKADVTGDGSGFSGVAAGASGTLNYSKTTSTAGPQSGTATVILKSTGMGGFADTILSSTPVVLNGAAYNYANARYTGGAVAFGNVHLGAVAANQSLAIGNQTVGTASYQDLLNVTATTDNAKVTASGFTNLAASTNGTTTNNLTFTANTSAVGSLAGTASLTLTSNANGVAGLSSGAATLVGSPTAVTTTGFVYSGLMLWNGASGTNWATNANWNDSANSSIHAAPGLDAGFTGVDSATLGNITGNVTLNLDAAAPSLNTLIFNSTGSYTLAQGAGSTGITLAGNAPGITATGTHILSAPVALANNATITVTNSNERLTVSGVISGSAKSLTKNGDGTLYLTGTNTYSGGTTISAGTLLINGTNSNAGSGALSVGTAGKLAGFGTLSASTTLQGIHAPGDNSVGIQSFSGGLAYAATSHLQWQLTDNLTSGRGSIYDGVNVTGGAFSIASGATIDLSLGVAVNFLNTFWDTTKSWKVVDLGVGASASGSGVFTVAALTGSNNYNPTRGYFTTARVTDTDGSNDVMLNWTLGPAPGNAYDSWIASKGLTGSSANADPDQDGVANALEFVLGGEPNPANPGSNSRGLLPSISRSAGNLVFTFQRTDVSESATTLTFQWSTDAAFSVINSVPVGAVGSSTNGVTVAITENTTNPDTIVITIPSSKAPGGKLFTRLAVSVP